jgi:hypothetical protein
MGFILGDEWQLASALFELRAECGQEFACQVFIILFERANQLRILFEFRDQSVGEVALLGGLILR